MTKPIEHRITLLIEGWNVGFNKVAFTKMLQHELGLSLTAAKNMTDQVLERTPIAINVLSADIKRISSLAQQIGAIVSSGNSSTSAIPEDSCR
jgi:signal transduction histidine kinase